MIWGDGRWKDSVLSRGHCHRSSSSKLLGYWGWNMEVCWGLPVVEMLLAIIIVMVVVFLVPIMAAPLTTILTAILRSLVLLTNILRILTINVLLEALWTQRTATLTTRPFTVGVIIFSTLARVRHVTNLATSWELTGSAGWHQLCLKTPKRSSKVRLFQ